MFVWVVSKGQEFGSETVAAFDSLSSAQAWAQGQGATDKWRPLATDLYSSWINAKEYYLIHGLPIRKAVGY